MSHWTWFNTYYLIRFEIYGLVWFFNLQFMLLNVTFADQENNLILIACQELKNIESFIS